MHADRFDRLVGAFGRAQSRRRVVRGAAGGVVALLGEVLGGHGAAQTRRCAGDGAPCAYDDRCCGVLLCLDGACLDYDG